MELTLNVFTLNCWGIPIVSKNRKERFEAIAKYLLDSSHTIVCLQEVWSEKDYLFLKDSLKTNLPYSYYFYSGVLGSGLCVFSKWVIEDVFFHQWPLHGYIHKIHHGDWFGGKGVGLCRIKCNDKIVHVYCTHLHAEYHEDDIYLAHRVLQAYSTAEFVKLTTSPADVSILAGDLNTAPGDLSYRLLTQLPPLVDPYDMASETKNQYTKEIGTCDNANNSYSNPKQVKILPDGKRIDHILFQVNPKWKAEVVSFGNPLADRVPGHDFSYSDHNAVALEFQLKPADVKTTQKQCSTDPSLDDAISEAIKVCKDAILDISRSKKMYLLLGGLLFMFLLGTVGYWRHSVLYDITKLVLTILTFYYIVMGTLWNKIEINSLKAGLSALENLNRTKIKLNDSK